MTPLRPGRYEVSGEQMLVLEVSRPAEVRMRLVNADHEVVAGGVFHNVDAEGLGDGVFRSMSPTPVASVLVSAPGYAITEASVPADGIVHDIVLRAARFPSGSRPAGTERRHDGPSTSSTRQAIWRERRHALAHGGPSARAVLLVPLAGLAVERHTKHVLAVGLAHPGAEDDGLPLVDRHLARPR